MGWFNALFSSTAADLLGSNKRKPTEAQESPAKKAKQQAGMPNTQTGHKLEPDLQKDSNHHLQARGDAAGTQHLISTHQGQQLQYNQPKQQDLMQQQQQDLMQQQQRPADFVFDGLGGSSQSQSQTAYQTARQMLVQPPSGTAAARRRQAAVPHKQKELRMPMPQQKPPLAQVRGWFVGRVASLHARHLSHCRTVPLCSACFPATEAYCTMCRGVAGV
jgi:hypothetical protein